MTAVEIGDLIAAREMWGGVFQIISMTQPTSHVFDAEDGDPYRESLSMSTAGRTQHYTSGQPTAVCNAPIDVVN
jgi:hypothetical protein